MPPATAMAASRDRGFTLLESALALAILALLAGPVLLAWRSPGLTAVQGEFRAALEEAFLLARARGREVRLGLAAADTGPPGLRLPRGVHWGLPGSIPLPPGMDRPARAHLSGAAHPQVTVTPRRTATASVWFLTDGRDALCLRLSGQGRVQLLRWRHGQRRWGGG
jgi:prepilin-type N-terminal cleavage/methylation domain-containing protein